MRRLLTISLLSALPVALAASVVVGQAGDSGHKTDRQPAASATTATTGRPTTTSATSRPKVSGGGPASEARKSGTARSTPANEATYVCPEGGIDAVIDLQHAVDEGHQPWRASAEDVAKACTFGPGSSLVPAGTNRYHVADPATGKGATVDLAQPLGPDHIWVVTRITYDARTAPPSPCSPEALLPPVRDDLERNGSPHIVRVAVRECQHGYARVHAIADNSRCGQPGGSCYEAEQVFLRASGGSWTVLTSGTGISCQDADIKPDLSVACAALGLRP